MFRWLSRIIEVLVRLMWIDLISGCFSDILQAKNILVKVLIKRHGLPIEIGSINARVHEGFYHSFVVFVYPINGGTENRIII